MAAALLAQTAIPVGASLWKTAQPWWEYGIRAALIYVFLLLVLRVAGKRQVGQLSPFDLVLLLVLSNAVQNSMNGGDNSVTAGMILVLTLFCLNSLVGYLSHRSKKLELIVEGKPQILVHNGVVDEEILARARISRHELMSAVRQVGIAELAEVRVAILENNGRINVIGRNP